MTTEDVSSDLFCRVATAIHNVPKHPHATLHPRERVTLALLFAFKGGGPRAFERGRRRDELPVFPKLPERTRLFRLCATHRAWADEFLADPTTLSVADSCGPRASDGCARAAAGSTLGARANPTSAGSSAARWRIS